MPGNNDFFTDFDDVSSAYDSENRPLSFNQTDFFKHSQCRDDNKSLIVLYHASNNDFTSFDPSKIGTGGGIIYGKGFYFCDNSLLVTDYGKDVKEYYLSLKNPFRWEMPEEDADYLHNLEMFIDVLEQNNFNVTDELRERLEEELLDGGGLDTIIEMTCGVDFAQKYFMRAGYDGIMNLEIGDYVAFKPEQIKLCSNRSPSVTNNIAA